MPFLLAEQYAPSAGQGTASSKCPDWLLDFAKKNGYGVVSAKFMFSKKMTTHYLLKNRQGEYFDYSDGIKNIGNAKEWRTKEEWARHVGVKASKVTFTEVYKVPKAKAKHDELAKVKPRKVALQRFDFSAAVPVRKIPGVVDKSPNVYNGKRQAENKNTDFYVPVKKEGGQQAGSYGSIDMPVLINGACTREKEYWEHNPGEWNVKEIKGKADITAFMIEMCKKRAFLDEHGKKYFSSYLKIVEKYCGIYKLPVNVALSMIFIESQGKPKATSEVGAKGLCQLMPYTAPGIVDYKGDRIFSVKKTKTKDKNGDEVTVLKLKYPKELINPEKNIHAGIAYLSKLVDHFSGQGIGFAFAAYNHGPGNTPPSERAEKLSKDEGAMDYLARGLYMLKFFNEIDISSLGSKSVKELVLSEKYQKALNDFYNHVKKNDLTYIY